jgi:hypothetical protein
MILWLALPATAAFRGSLSSLSSRLRRGVRSLVMTAEHSPKFNLGVLGDLHLDRNDMDLHHVS